MSTLNEPIASPPIPEVPTQPVTPTDKSGTSLFTTGNPGQTTEGNSTAMLADVIALLALAGAAGDANTVASFMGRLTKIRDLLAATLTVQGTITEANSAASKADLDEIAFDTDNLATILSTLQGLLTITRKASSVYTAASGALTTSATGSGDLSVGAYTEIAIDINLTTSGGTNPTIQFFWDRKGADGIYYPIWQSAVQSTFSATTYLSTAIGAGMAYNQSLGLNGRLRWTVGGTNTPSVTCSLSIYGK